MRAFRSMLVLCLLITAPLKADPLEVSLSDIDGVEHHLADLRGKWVVVNVWATWCPPCLAEIPELDIFHQQHKDKDAVVWGLNAEDITLKELKKFVEQEQIHYPVFQIPPEQDSIFGPIPGIPTTYIVSPSGEVAARKVGGIRLKDLETFLQENSLE